MCIRDRLTCAEEAKSVFEAVKNAEFKVSSVTKGETKKNPPPPFITSTLQQDAARKLGFSTSRTMQTAQSLYEGINIGGRYGTIGLITYMRTDSLRISEEAKAEAIAYLNEKYGKEYVNPCLLYTS